MQGLGAHGGPMSEERVRARFFEGVEIDIGLNANFVFDIAIDLFFDLLIDLLMRHFFRNW